MDDSKTSNPSPEKPTDKDYKKKRVEEIGSTLAQIKARVKANRSCARKDDETKPSSREKFSEKSEKYIQVIELDKAKAQKLEKERPKIKEALENLKIDRENQKLVEKKIEETRAKQSAPLPEIPVEVQKRISDLEITIHNLKETLSEKERVLESKTESWRLLSDQLEQRNLEVEERYEMMAKEIDEAKRSYADQEVFLRSELEKSKSKLQEAKSQLISQENWRQEQEETKAEFEQLKQTHSECEGKVGEFQRSLEAEKKLCLKLKAQIKNYRNQMNSKKDLTGEVEKLQNQIATLEEEKEAAAKNQERVNQLESALATMEADLISTREQCDRVNEDYKDLCLKLNEKEEVIRSLNETLEKTEQSKISSEFKAAELEEKLESENREDRAQNDKMCKEIDNLKRHFKEQEEMVEELKKLVFQKEEEIKKLSDNRDMDYSFAYDTQDLKDLLEEWKSKYSRIEENVRIVEEEKETLSVNVQTLQVELDTVNNRCQNIITELSQKESLIDEFMKKNNELVESLAKSSEKIMQLENELKSDKKPETKNDDQTQKLKKLAANLKIKMKLCKELEVKVDELNEKLSHQENTITLLTDEKTDLENLVTEYKMKLENVSVDTDVVEQLKNMLSEKELIIRELTEQEGRKLKAIESKAIEKTRTESYSELVEKDSTIKHLKEEKLMLESKINENMIEIHSVGETEKKPAQSEDQARDQVSQLELERAALLEEVDSSLSQIKHLTQELEIKVKIIEELQTTVSDLNLQLESANLLQSETKNNLDAEVKLVDELKSELVQLKNSQEIMSSEISEKNELMERTKILQIELEKCQKIIGGKEEIINRFEQEMNSLKNEINQNENQLVKMQELYDEESTRKEGVITNIQSLADELSLSKNEMISLSEQLGEVSSNYEQCMLRLQEKDKYIDKLEKDLNDMRDKVQNLECTIEERQKAMEERAKQLGEKLNEASTIGSNFEQYRAEMEQQLNQFDETEKQLTSRINELTQINCELENNKREASNKVKELEGELNDIKSAYNTTLDQIELLNGELNQVMAQIEHRNKELVRIGEERNSLIGRLSELEGTCGDLRSRLQQYEEQSVNLKSELDNKLKELDLATAEITNLQSQLGTNQLSENTELNKELEVLKTEYEERLRELQVEKNDLLKVIKGSVESEVDSLMKAAEEKVEKKEEIQMFSWEGHTENTPLDDLNEDSWGWNASEVKLAEEYQNSEANKIRLYEEEREKLKNDNEKLEEEVKSLKIKCTKLVAKVKEMKASSEKTKNKTGFADLDFAMQEELRSQVDEIDKKNKELQTEVSTMKVEKERLLKRIETLTSANNQLIEMKERQDIEVQVWQRNCSDLKNQLQSFDWNESETKQEMKSVSMESRVKSNSELEDKLTFLETENEELLQIICSLRDEKQANSNNLTELNNVKEENQKLKENKESTMNQYNLEINQLKQLLENEKLETQSNLSCIEKLNKEKNDLETSLESLKKELEASQEHYNTLSNLINDSSSNNDEIKSQYDSLKIELENKVQHIVSLNDNISSLQENINRLNEDNSLLKTSGHEKDLELSKLNDELSQLNLAVKHIEGLQAEQLQLSNEIDRLKSVVESLTVDNENLLTSYNSKVAEMDLLKADMKITEASKDAAINDLQNLQDELNRLKTEEVQPTSNVFQAPPSSSVFGNISASPASSIFGNVSTPPTSSIFDNVSAPPTSSIFGNVSAPSTTSIFGNVSAPPTSAVFGSDSVPNTSSIFGNVSASPTSSLFDNVSAQTASSIFGSVSTPPPTSSLFDNISAPPATSMFSSVFNIFAPKEPAVQSSSVSKTTSTPFDIPISNVDQSSLPLVAESPPVFKGFFSDQNHPSTHSFDIKPQEPAEVSHDALDSSVQNTEAVQQLDANQLQSLKDEQLKLEQGTFSLIKKIEDSQSISNDEGDLLKRISIRDDEISNLKNQIEELNLEIRRNADNFEVEKSQLIKSNQELMLKINESQNSVEFCEREIIRLKTELDELRKQEVIQSEHLRNNDVQALQEHFEEKLRQSERNFQNILLNKDEENAHLVCDASSKQALCDKLSAQVETIKSQLTSLESDFKSSKELNEAQSGEISSLKQELDRVNYENGELRKVKENDSQHYAAQIDYLQQSVQEKDSNIENLNIRCNQLSEQISTVQEELRLSQERSSYLDNCYSSLTTAHNQQGADYNAVLDRLRAADGEIERLSIAVAALTQEVNEHKARLEQEKFSNESLRSKEADQTRLLSSEIEILQSAITEKDLEIERLSKLLTGLQEKLIKAEESKISDEVLRLRDKLDKALYTLHLRDTKCDELTVEIMHLLGERDSLQLRLSEALRMNERFRNSPINLEKPSSESPPSLTESKSTHDLNTKMGELQAGYMKDPAVREDRENRHSQQMHLYTSTETAAAVPVKKQEPANSDYGILNWFFSSSTSPQPSQEPPT